MILRSRSLALMVKHIIESVSLHFSIIKDKKSVVKRPDAPKTGMKHVGIHNA